MLGGLRSFKKKSDVFKFKKAEHSYVFLKKTKPRIFMRGKIIPLFIMMGFLFLAASCSNKEDKEVAVKQKQKELLEQSNQQLFIAILEGNEAKVKEYLRNNASVNSFNAKGNTPLIEAIKQNNLYIIKTLVAQKADVNLADKKGITPLMHVIQNRNKTIPKVLDKGQIIYVEQDGTVNLFLLEFLVGSGADINAKDVKNRTALNLAAASGNIDAVRFLIENKANVTLKDLSGRTPLISAAMNGYTEIAEILVSANDDIDCIDNEKQTPLMHAAQNGYGDIVHLLLKKGAQVNIKDQFGATASKLAKLRGFNDIAAVLERLEKKK